MAIEPRDKSAGGGLAQYDPRAVDGPDQVNRIMKLVISKIIPNQFRVDGNNSLLIEIDGGHKAYGGLRMKGSFRRPLVWAPSIGTVEIYNLNQTTRALLQETNAKVVIFAGYRATGLKQLGILSAAQINHTKVGPHWITKLEGGDGGRQHWHARVRESFAGNTRVDEVIGKLAGKSGLKLGSSFLGTLRSSSNGKTFKQGKSFQGHVMDELRYLCKLIGLDMFISDETLYVVPPDGNIGQALVVNASSGLIGSPAYAAAPHPGKPKIIKWKQLLWPEGLPGKTVNLDSRYHKGFYKVREMAHTWDTWDLPWYTDNEAIAQKLAK